VTTMRAATATLPTRRARWTPPPPTAADLARQLRDAVADLPRFLTAPLLRRRHRTWGATPAEITANSRAVVMRASNCNVPTQAWATPVEPAAGARSRPASAAKSGR
jgi:hypothetical protein